MTPLVVKLGGSLMGTDRLQIVLDLIRRSSKNIVIVPGGGGFADAVRDSQRRHGLSDAVAHRMALLAMHQMAEVIISCEPAMSVADSLDDIVRAWGEGRTSVWRPYAMAIADYRMPQDWSITSDGLAAWLALRLPGAEVLLVKSCSVPATSDIAALAASGIVDPWFAAACAGSRLVWHVAGDDMDARLGALLGIGTTTP